MNWNEIKRSIIDDLQSRDLSDPSIRINALESVENIMKSHLKEMLNHPSIIKKIEKNEFKKQIAFYKSNRTLNDAESSVINEIYYRLLPE